MPSLEDVFYDVPGGTKQAVHEIFPVEQVFESFCSDIFLLLLRIYSVIFLTACCLSPAYTGLLEWEKLD